MSDWVTEYLGLKPKRKPEPSAPARTDLSRSVPTLVSPPTGSSATSGPGRTFSSDLENLSIGLGRGLTSGLEGIKALVTEPGEVLEGMKQFAGQVIDDPRVLAEMAKEYGIKATSGPLGFGEVVGEMVSPLPRTKVPTTQIVKPKGNLNLSPAIRAEALKGPEKQTLESFRQQAAKLPGVTKGGFEENVLLPSKISTVSPQTVMTKSEFEKEFVPPSEYGKIDLKSGADDAFEHYVDLAGEQLNSNYEDVMRATMERVGLNYDNERSYEQYVDFINGSTNLDRSFMDAMRRAGVSNPDQLSNLETEVFGDLVQTYARDMMDNDVDNAVGGYSYESFQRLMDVPKAADPGYFEIGVTHPAMEGKPYRHYQSASEPLIGHVRGTYLEPGMSENEYRVVLDWAGNTERGYYDTFTAKPNSVVLEEFQSDVQKGDFGQKGVLRQVHGTLLKAGVQDALERGADTVYVPTSVPIAAVRGAKPSDYTSIYDQQVAKEGLNPLKQIPGVSIEPITHKGRVAYFQVDFSPEAKEYILKGPGQLAPGYADGGRVEEEEYDEDAIEEIVESLRRRFEQVAGVARAVPRKLKQTAADVTDIGEIISRSKKIPLEYFDPKSEVAGEADAMRHLLFQAQLAQKYGDMPAQMVSYLHEYTSPGQPSAEREMDLYNDILGREIAKKAKSEKELVELARRYVQSGRAKTLPKEQRGGY